MGLKQCLAWCACLLFLVALSSCGAGGGGGNASGGTKSSSAAAGPVIKTVEVKETEFKLDPAKITLNKPGTYVFKAVNSGTTTHALEIEGKGVEKETGNLNPGQSAELKVTLKPGKYEIYCPIDSHRQQGMEGTVTVKQGSGGGSGGY
jgi:plastocyanin